MRFRMALVAISCLNVLIACSDKDQGNAEPPDGQVGGAVVESGPDGADEKEVPRGSGGSVDGAADGNSNSTGGGGASGSGGTTDSGVADHVADSEIDVRRDATNFPSDGGPEAGTLSDDVSDAAEASARDADDAGRGDTAESGACIESESGLACDAGSFAQLAFGNSPASAMATTMVSFPVIGGDVKTYVPFINVGNASSGPITLTNSAPQEFPSLIFSCVDLVGGLPVSVSAGIGPGVLCELEVNFASASPGLRTGQLTLSATPGGTITAMLRGCANGQCGDAGPDAQ